MASAAGWAAKRDPESLAQVLRSFDAVFQTKDYPDLKAFKETETQSKEDECLEIQTKLSSTDLSDYELIKDDLSVSKRLKYLKSKISNRTDISIDTTKGTSGVGLKIPDNFKDFISLSTDKQKEIKEKYPKEFRAILETMPKG